MSFSWARVGAIVRKELRDYRRNRFVVLTMSFLPLVFIVAPVIQLFTIKVSITSSKFDDRIGLALLYMLILPAIIPSVLSAYSVVGEREQGTLEPVLTTPIHSEEFLVGKALAALLPTLAVAYVIFGIFLGAIAAFAHPAVSSAIFERNHLLVQLLFTPLVAGWSIWAGIAISTRMSDVRAAQQLAVLASLPPVAIVALMNFNVITASLSLALGLAGALLLIDGMAWRFVAALFNRERLVTGTRELSPHLGAAAEMGRERKNEMAATLKLTRQGVGIELRRGTFDLLVDGDSVGSINWHDTVEVPVEPGRHKIRVRAGRYSSEEHSFEAADGETVTFRVHGAMVWPRYLASVVKPDLAISLKRE